MYRTFITCLLTILLVLSAGSVQAYTLRTNGRSPEKWAAKKSIEITVSSSLLKSNNVKSKGADDLDRVVRNALAVWSKVSGIQFTVVYSDAQSAIDDSKNLVTIASSSEDLAPFKAKGKENWSAYTRLYTNEAGYIVQADILLNPYTLFSTTHDSYTFYLQSTLVHEFGHALGLDHSDVKAATMRPSQEKSGINGSSSITMCTLSSDDIAGIKALYQQGSTGTIRGTLRLSNNQPCARWLVWATDPVTGTIVASTTTSSDGSFLIPGLPAGSYVVQAETMKGTLLDTVVARLREADKVSAGETFLGMVDVGTVNVSANKTATLNAKVEVGTVPFEPLWLGSTIHLTNNAIPITSSVTPFFISVNGLKQSDLPNVRITTSSNSLIVDQQSITSQYSVADGPNVYPVIHGYILAREGLVDGDYNLCLSLKDGGSTCMLGALTVDSANNQTVSSLSYKSRPLTSLQLFTNSEKRSLFQPINYLSSGRSNAVFVKDLCISPSPETRRITVNYPLHASLR
jgi:hypothetical protein